MPIIMGYKPTAWKWAQPHRSQRLCNANTPVSKRGQPQHCSNYEESRGEKLTGRASTRGTTCTTYLKWSDLLHLFVILSQTYNHKNSDCFFLAASIYKGCIPLATAPFLFFQWQTSSTARQVLWLRRSAQSKSPSLISCLSFLLLTHFSASSKMNPDKQHLSRNCRHTYWAPISIFLSVEQSKENPQRGLASEEKHIDSLKTSKCRWFVRFTLRQAELQSKSYPLTATDNPAIVSTARQLYTHSKNVSLLCFLYTKRCLFHSYCANTGPSYNQRKETYERKEVETRAAVWSRNETITSRQKKNTQRKQTKESTGKGVRTWGRTGLAV